MASRDVADKMNRVIAEYLGHLGVSEAAGMEVANNANAMRGLGAFNSQWFSDITLGLRQILEAILRCQSANPVVRRFDLNEPPPDELEVMLSHSSSNNSDVSD